MVGRLYEWQDDFGQKAQRRMPLAAVFACYQVQIDG
jgi:hypothetical protein